MFLRFYLVVALRPITSLMPDRMNIQLLIPSAFGAAIMACGLFAASAQCQTTDKTNRNNPFAPSPATKSRYVESDIKPVMIESVSYSTTASIPTDRSNRLSIVPDNDRSTRRGVTAGSSPTSIYRVGVGDVLVIEIQNSSTSSGHYTVRNDGTIDFPLAGEYVSVADKTTDEIEGHLSESISLYSAPQVSVKIAEYVSHGVLVNGLVEVPGFHQIHRDAVPLFVIRAAAGVTQNAKRVTIKRERTLGSESYLLSSPNADRTLIFPGDSVEFTGNQ